MIVGFNYLLRNIIIVLLKWIGKKTLSSQMNTMMIYMFISQFINTALILLFVFSNFENAQFPFIRQLANGPYPDFTMNWYLRVGAMYTQTFVILSLSPIIDAVITWVLIRLYQKFDIGTFSKMKPGHVYETSAKSVQQFLNTYSGPEMLFHYRYSLFMIQVFTCMLFGVGLPILFPIVLVSLIIQYVVDRLLIVYIYKQPPHFDQ